MIVPIIKKINGEDQTIGTARILNGSDEVEFYLQPGFILGDAVKKQLVKQLKKLARS